MSDRSKRSTTLRRGALRPIFLAAAFSVGGSLALSTDADAYVLEGLRWAGTPTSGCCANLGVQYNTVTQSYDSAGLFAGFVGWNHSFSSGVNVNCSTVSSSVWTVQDVYNPGSGWDGLTPITGSNGYFTMAMLQINYYYTQFYSQQTINGVAAHEIGHSLGLAHAPGCVLMTPTTAMRNSCGIYGPVQDDKNGVNSLY
ncbi:MAG TPA: matrixin family metalloprotease [Polyangiaceae bacterium]|jgi:hypothetical protein|nr:matrixin family metalloprotease [Polyangiaceae bacterium]